MCTRTHTHTSSRRQDNEDFEGTCGSKIDLDSLKSQVIYSWYQSTHISLETNLRILMCPEKWAEKISISTTVRQGCVAITVLFRHIQATDTAFVCPALSPSLLVLNEFLLSVDKLFLNIWEYLTVTPIYPWPWSVGMR